MIDPNIAMGYRPVQVEPQSNALARALGIQGAMNQNRAQELAFQKGERDLARQNRLEEILGAGGGEQELMRGGFVKEAGDIGKIRRENKKLESEQQRTELEAAAKRVGLIGQVLGATQDQATWNQGRAFLQQQGIDTANFPEQFDPRGAAFARQQAIDAAKQIDQALAERGFIETQRHNQAGEATARGNLAVAQGQLGVARDRLAFDREAPRGVPLDTPQGPVLVDPRTGTARPVTVAGRAIPSKDAAARASKAPQILSILNEAEPLVDKATGSGVGAARDYAGALVGRSGESADALAQLKVLQAQLMLAQPRMEGPQSDRDAQLYREAAASLGDPMVPNSQKKAALKMIRDLNERYAGTTPAAAGLPAGWSITPVAQ